MPFNMRRGGYVLSLEVITGTNLVVPSSRTPAGHYVRIFTSYGQYNTAIKSPMSDCSVSWNETLIIRGRQLMHPPHLMPTFSRSSKKVRLEIRASFECVPMLGRGELVGTFETTLDHLLVHDGPFVTLSAVGNNSLSLTLKAQHTKIPHHTADGTMQIGRDTDAARDAYALFRKSNLPIDLDIAIRGFQSVLERCPLDHPDRAAALSNLAHAILCGTDIDLAISLFRSALALRPLGHANHILSIIDLCQALQQRHTRQKDNGDLREAAKLYRSILSLCVEGSYLHRVVFDTNGVFDVIEQCNALPSDPSDDSISLRRIVLEICPPKHQHHAYSLNKLAGDLYARFKQSHNPDYFIEAVHWSREALTARNTDRSREALTARNTDDDELFALPGILMEKFWLYHSDPFKIYETIPLDIHREEVDSRSITSTQYSECYYDQRSGPRLHVTRSPGMSRMLDGIAGPKQKRQPLPPHIHPPNASSIKPQTRPLTRNVVIFGDSGSGKSSVINAIAQTKIAQTSSGAAGCTFSYQRYKVEISGQRFVLFDTAGLNEGTAGTVPAAKAEEKLKSLLSELLGPGSDGISLLVYCVRSTRARRALIRNYNVFYSAICRKKVPIVVVVTGLENEPDMESWWDTNGMEFKSRGMHFEDHACVTTLHKHSGISDVFSRRIEESSETLRNLIVNNYSDWVVDKSWFKQSFAALRNMINDGGNSERSSPSTLIICDPSRNEEVEIAPYMNATLRTYLAHIGGEAYQVYRVSAPEPHFPSSSAEKRLEGDLLIYYARADELSTARQKFYAFYTAYRGNVVPVIVVVKGLNDSESAHQWVEEYIMHDGAGRLFSTFAPAEEFGDDSVRGQAAQELQDLIIRSCLIRNERKGRGGRQKKSVRRSRV